MDRLIQAFTRVLRGLAEAQELIDMAAGLENGQIDESAVFSSDRLGILDFPDAEQQEANIATATSLSTSDLLERAAESPGCLNLLEIKVSKQRYWLDLTGTEKAEHSRAQSALLAVSEGHWREVTEQLRRIRSLLYNKHEEQALSNAEIEEWRRDMEAMKQRKRQEVEAGLSRAQPWVKRLWDEDHAERKWGFTAFLDPMVEEDEENEFDARKDAALTWARDAVGCGGVIGQQWRIQYLDWPDEITDDDDRGEDVETEEDENGNGKSAAPPDTDRADDAESAADSERFESDLTILRERFRALRDRASHKRRKTKFGASTSELEKGMLHNVFLLFTQSAVNSVIGSPNGPVDDMWAWAVDPDYEAPAPGPSKMGYKGYLRVRLQQLGNNFFEVRRFQDQLPMEQLWKAAQQSRNQAFTSLKDHEARLWTTSRDVGSALRPPGSVKVITSLDDL